MTEFILVCLGMLAGAVAHDIRSQFFGDPVDKSELKRAFEAGAQAERVAAAAQFDAWADALGGVEALDYDVSAATPREAFQMAAQAMRDRFGYKGLP